MPSTRLTLTALGSVQSLTTNRNLEDPAHGTAAANMQTLPKEGTNDIAVPSATAHSQDQISDQVTTNALSKDARQAKAPPKRFIRQQVKTTWPLVLSGTRSTTEVT